jgi:polar amino acid transport system substrate-binding protein
MKKRRRYLVLSIFEIAFAISLGWVSSSKAAGEVQKVAIVALGLPRPPYVDLSENSGLEYEIIGAALQKVGIELKPVFASLSRSEVLFRQGDVDGISSYKNAHLEGYASNPYIDYYNVAATLKKKHIALSKIEDLSHYSVAGFQTSKERLGPKYQRMADANPRYTEVATQESQIEQLLRGRVDVIVADVLIIKSYQRVLKEKFGLDSEIEIHDLFPVNSYVVFFRDKNSRDLFNQGLKMIRQNQTYLKIIGRHEKWTSQHAAK